MSACIQSDGTGALECERNASRRRWTTGVDESVWVTTNDTVVCAAVCTTEADEPAVCALATCVDCRGSSWTSISRKFIWWKRGEDEIWSFSLLSVDANELAMALSYAAIVPIRWYYFIIHFRCKQCTHFTSDEISGWCGACCLCIRVSFFLFDFHLNMVGVLLLFVFVPTIYKQITKDENVHPTTSTTTIIIRLILIQRRMKVRMIDGDEDDDEGSKMFNDESWVQQRECVIAMRGVSAQLLFAAFCWHT